MDRFRYLRVAVVGDVMLDANVQGSAVRLSPEAPVPVLGAERLDFIPGGAGHSAAVMASLGAQVTILGAVGDDWAASRLIGALEGSGVEGRLVCDNTRPTTVKWRFFSGTHHLLRVDVESTQALDSSHVSEVLPVSKELIHSADIVAISDYAKGVLTTEVTKSVITESQSRGVPCVVDPKGTRFDKYRGASVITPNLMEAASAAGKKASDSPEGWGSSISSDLPETLVLITQGRNGVSAFRHGRLSWHVPAVAREVYDVTGAGDTFNAVLTLGIAAGLSDEKAARLAVIGAGVSVSRVGTVPITREELEASLAKTMR